MFFVIVYNALVSMLGLLNEVKKNALYDMEVMSVTFKRAYIFLKSGVTH